MKCTSTKPNKHAHVCICTIKRLKWAMSASWLDILNGYAVQNTLHLDVVVPMKI